VTTRQCYLRSGARIVDPVSHAPVSSWGSVAHNDTPRRLVEPLLAFAHFAIDAVSRVKGNHRVRPLATHSGHSGFDKSDKGRAVVNAS